MDATISRLVKTIIAGAAATGGELSARQRPEREIRELLERDYSGKVREKFGPREIKDLVAAARAIWPDFNQAPMGPPSMRLFSEVANSLKLHFSSAPYPESGGFAVRGFYVNKTPAALGKPLIYVNTAHHPLAVGTAFCHEVGHHLSADMFAPQNKGARLFFGSEYATHLEEPGELAADILVSLAGYPYPIARSIFSARPGTTGTPARFGMQGGNVFAEVREHLSSRYGFDFTAALPPTLDSPTVKLHYLTGMIHYARLRETLLTEYGL